MPGGFGAYGKMPALGDFFRINLARSFVETWDNWLQDRLTGARATLGDRWQGSYLSAPIWRFTLSGGLAGPAPMIGVMMASVDRVGRQFPLTLAGALPADAEVAGAHLLLVDTFVALEEIALDTLDDTMTRDILAERLAGIGPVPAPAGCTVTAAAAPAVLTAAGPDETRLAAGIAAHLLGQRLRAPSLWSAATESGPRLLVCEGMPSPRQFADLMDSAAPLWSAGMPPVQPATQRLA
jgi:type VI secretion system protein ImpM